MSGTISTRWYFPDWTSDEGVRACSLAARGLWMDLLCIAASNSGRDHGFVVINGKIPTSAQIARRVGASIEEVEALLIELRENGVPSVDKRGAFYNRRMVRAEKNRGNGRLGGNPKLLKENEKQKSVRVDPKPLIPEPDPEPELFPPGGGSARARKALLPDGWMPTIADREYAREHGFEGRRLNDLAQAFSDHHRAKANRLADWGAAWRTWVRNEIKYSAQRGGARRATSSGFAAVSRELRERRQAEEDENGSDDEGPYVGGTLPAIHSH